MQPEPSAPAFACSVQDRSRPADLEFADLVRLRTLAARTVGIARSLNGMSTFFSDLIRERWKPDEFRLADHPLRMR